MTTGLRAIAEQDLGNILEDSDYGFGWSIAVTAPDGVKDDTLIGFSNDIAQIIDPDTGQAVSGRLASAALRMSSLQTAFPTQGLPKGVADENKKPWIVEFNDINGSAYKFKVQESSPDRALGMVICILEEYK